ncbi:MAG: VF530 family protein, partial [Polyangiaceae bacterium]|nr:VF530 family protein [Polyangiaceae bacterium]
MIVEELHEELGWEGLAARVKVRCFTYDPSLKSALKFLRRTPWARQEVEELWLELIAKTQT